MRILIPPAVRDEVATGAVGAAELAQASWLIVEAPRDAQAVALLRQSGGLDAGEAEAIVLAGELGARLLLDERRGRRVASGRGITVVGTVAVVVAASRMGLIGVDDVEPLLRRMVAAGFHLSDYVIRLAVAQAHQSV